MKTILGITHSGVHSRKAIQHLHPTLGIPMIKGGCSRIRMALPAGTARLALTFLFTALFAFSGGYASAQIATADVSGSVRDSSAALIPGATVTATQVSTGVVTTTTANSDGIFVFSTLPVGTYVLRVTAPGFAAYEQTNLSLTVGQHLTVDAALNVGTSNQTITVASTAVALDSTSPTIQSVIEEKIVQNLPLNGRNPATLAYTVAGVVDSAANPINRATNSSFAPNDAVSAQESAPSVHGSRPGGTYFSLDGANNTDPYTVVGGPFPNPDATGEFSVVTGTYGAQYVSAPGGAINIVSRSGGNQIHGALFEFIRNGYFNAQNKFITPPAKDNLPSDYLQVQPRIGLVYAAAQRTVVRAGFGLYTLQLPESVYSGFSAQPFTRNYLIEQPFLSIDNLWGSAMLTNPFATGFQGKNYQPAKNIAFQSGLGASAFSQNFKPGYVQQWSLSVQQTLSQSDSVEMAYVGTEGVHLTLGVSENTPVYSATASASNEQARRPYQDFTNIGEIASSGTSSYNGVDVSYRHRSKLFTVSSAFTWSKALDDGSSSVNAGTINLPDSNHNFRRGRSDFDQNFVFRNTFTTTSPKLQDLNFATRSVLGSWTLSGLVALDAGQPFSVTDGGDFSYTGLNIDYADRVPGQPVYVNGMLNFKAFTNNAPGTFGNSGRNAYRSPSYKELDLAAEKAFPVRKEFQLLFRAEAFNVANHPNLLANQAATSYSSTAQQTFGVYGLARDPRILQFSLKASF